MINEPYNYSSSWPNLTLNLSHFFCKRWFSIPFYLSFFKKIALLLPSVPSGKCRPPWTSASLFSQRERETNHFTFIFSPSLFFVSPSTFGLACSTRNERTVVAHEKKLYTYLGRGENYKLVHLVFSLVEPIGNRKKYLAHSLHKGKFWAKV